MITHYITGGFFLCSLKIELCTYCARGVLQTLTDVIRLDTITDAFMDRIRKRMF